MRFPIITPTKTWYLTLVLTTILAGLVAAHSVDPDAWWRLRHGQDILSSGISTLNAYSYTMPSFPFVSHAWTFDGALAWGAAHMGYPWVATLITLFVAATFAAITYTLRTKWLGSILLIILWTGCLNLFGVRDQVLTWPLIAVSTWLILLPETRWKQVRWYLPLLALLWANIHGSFPLLLGLLGLRLVVTSLHTKYIDWIDVIILAASLPITLLNPYGVLLWQEIWLTSTDHTLASSVLEWRHVWSTLDTHAPILVAIVCSSGALAFMKRHWLGCALIGLSGMAAVLSIRHMPILVIIAVILSSQLLRSFSWPTHWHRPWEDAVLRKGICALIGLASLLIITVWYQNFTSGQALPVAATAWLKENRPHAVIFNHYNWGGYLIWARPEGKVFIDGRMPSWRWTAPSGELDWAERDWRAISKGDTTLFNQDVALFNIDTILWPTFDAAQSPLLTMLPALGWEEVYKDAVAVIYQKPYSPQQQVAEAPALQRRAPTPVLAAQALRDRQ